MTTYLTSLSSRSALVLEGPDGRKFLQGQTTCDLDQLSAEHSLTGAYCNPQGRMVCDFRLLELPPEAILMVLQASAAAAALETFGKYIVFSRAELRDAGDDWRHYALWGQAAAALAEAPGSSPDAGWRQGDILWTTGASPDSFEACVPATAADAFETRMTELGAERVAEEAYQLLEIKAGIGHVTGATSGEFLPQMLNFQATGRVSFTKGCYTGQEVVARMHYRGKVKRPMALASADASEDLQPGDSIIDVNGKTVGTIVNAARDGDGLCWLLASLTRDAVNTGASAAGSPLSFHALPYPLEDEAGSD